MNSKNINKKKLNSLQETEYLLSTKANKKALFEGINECHSTKILTPEEWNKLINHEK